MVNTKTLLYCVLALAALFMTACGGGGGDGGGGSAAVPVTSSASAEFVVRGVAAGVIQRNLLPSLADGSHTGTVVTGLSGTATVSGNEVYFIHQSCGTDCIKSSRSIDISVVFNGYAVMSADNTKTTLTGTVTYTDNTWNRQSGLSYSSGGSVSAASNSVTYDLTENTGSFAYSDIIEFSASGSDASYISGWCRPKNGTTYLF